MDMSSHSSESREQDDLKLQLAALRAEVETLNALIAKRAAERASAEAADPDDTLDQLRSDAESAVRSNPLSTLAICAGVGFFSGAAMRQ